MSQLGIKFTQIGRIFFINKTRPFLKVPLYLFDCLDDLMKELHEKRNDNDLKGNDPAVFACIYDKRYALID